MHYVFQEYAAWYARHFSDFKVSLSSRGGGGGAGNFYLQHHVQNGSRYQGSFPGSEADHSPASSAEVKECVELYLYFPNTPSWRGAQLKESTGTNLHLHLPFVA
jgi:hypothetical protein